MKEITRWGVFKFLASKNRLTAWSTVNGQHSNFLVFSCLVILPMPFSIYNPQIFMSNAKGILIFGQNLTFFLRLFIYDAYDMKLTQS